MKPQFWTIAKKEFFSYLNSPVAYVILVPFLVLNSFLFMRSALVLGDANLRPMIELLPWFLMIIGPALAMRAFADERRKDTLELVYAHPVSEWTVVLAKYTGLLLFYGLMLLFTLPLPLTLGAFSSPDPGLVVSQYLGAFLVGSVFLAVGVTTSAVIGNAVGGFLVGAAVNFILLLIGMSFVTLMFPGIIGRVVNEAAVMPHVTSISRGVIDFRDLLYFGTLIVLALTLAVIKLSERKVAEIPAERRKLWIVMTLTLAIGMVGNFVVYEYPIRIDLTSDHRYSLSKGTRQLLHNLPDRVTITLYSSQNLPGPMQVTLRETGDWLKDFKRYGKKVAIRTVITDASAENKNEAVQKGIREVQFNQIGTSSFQVQTGFLGMDVRYGTKNQVIDFIEDSSNLEYQLSRLILKLTQEKQPKIGLLSQTGELNTTLFGSLLGEQYDVVQLSQSSTTDDVMGLAGMIVLDDGSEKNATGAALVKQYLNNGGSVLAMVDGMNVSARTLQPMKSESDLIGVLGDWGIHIKPNLVYDAQLNEPVTLGGGSVRYVMPYPFWMRALVQKSTLPVPASLNNVLLGWASAVEGKGGEGITITPLLTTGAKSGGVQDSNFAVNPQDIQRLAKPTGQQTVGVVATKNNQRLVVIGDADLTSDDFLKNTQEDSLFVANAADWVIADPILNQILRRGPSRNVFKFDSPAQITAAQYGNVAVPALLAAGFGAWWLLRRRNLAKRTWQGGKYANQ